MEKNQKIIVHIIDSLSRGGAELLLMNTLELLPQFHHVVIYLNEPNTLTEYYKKQNVEFICLQHKGWRDIIQTVLKLKRLISQLYPVLVHSHLFYSTLFARLAVPSSVPLISTIHSLYSKDAFEKNSNSLLIEKLTIRKRHTIIAVSKFVMDDYLKYVHFHGKKFVLYNFIPASFFKKRNQNFQPNTVKCIAVGNLKEAKNYPYLLAIFRHFKNDNISLDIYGAGNLEKDLQLTIDKEKLNVRLCSGTSNIPELIHQYDLFLQASAHEGFGLSVIESMAAGIPIIVSDIPVFREITNDLAQFFPLDDATKAAAGIKLAIQNKSRLSDVADRAFSFAQEQYSEQVYIKKLLSIYEEVAKLNP